MRQSSGKGIVRLACVLLLTFIGLPAQAQPVGFQLNRFEPTPSGSLFFRVEHPYYSAAQSWAAGLSTLYSNNVFSFAESVGPDGDLFNKRGLIEHQLVSHLDLSGSLFDRVQLGGMLPILWLESGQAAFDVAPISGVTVGDPRLLATVRLYGHAHKSRWSAHGSAAVWIPLRAMTSSLPAHTSDQGARVRLSAVLAGLFRSVHWSASLALHLRSVATLSDRLSPVGTTTGSEIEIGLAAGFDLPRIPITLAPELVFATSVVPSQALRVPYSSLEVLLGLQHVIAKRVQVALGVGVGFLRAPGTPDARLTLRLAYVGKTRDRDQDGIRDEYDACPDQKGPRSDVPSNNGCPAILDRDCDGVADAEDECPDLPEGQRPDPSHLGCPRRDRVPRVSDEPPPQGERAVP